MRAIRSSRQNRDKERRRKRKQRRGRMKRRIMEEYRKSSVMMEGKGFVIEMEKSTTAPLYCRYIIQ